MWVFHLDGSLHIEATGSQVTHTSLKRTHATFTPDAALAVSGFLQSLSRVNDYLPVLTSFLRFRRVIGGSLAFVFPFVVHFYNGRGTAEQWIKEGKNAVTWTKLSCRTFKDNLARLQLFAMAYNLVNFLRRLALPPGVKHWSLTTLREKLVKIGTKVVRHATYVTFQLAEVAVPPGPRGSPT